MGVDQPYGVPVVSWDVLAQHRERLLRIAHRRVPVGADAEDCVQEALLRASHVPGVPPDRIGPLLTTVTVRLCIDWQRRHKIATRAIASYAGRRDVCPDPIEEVDDRAEAAWLRQAVDGLADTERAVMLARADGRSVSETARQLGITYKAAEGALTRARRKLRLALAGAAAILTFARRNTRTVVLTPTAFTLTAVLLLPNVSGGTAPGAAPPVTVEHRVVDQVRRAQVAMPDRARDTGRPDRVRVARPAVRTGHGPSSPVLPNVDAPERPQTHVGGTDAISMGHRHQKLRMAEIPSIGK